MVGQGPIKPRGPGVAHNVTARTEAITARSRAEEKEQLMISASGSFVSCLSALSPHYSKLRPRGTSKPMMRDGKLFELIK